MKSGFKSSVLIGVFFAVPMFFCFWLTGGSPGIAAVSAVFAGLLFAVFTSIFGKMMKRSFEASPPPLDPGETLLHSGPANHMRGAEGVGGYLYLTSHRILFRPHSINFQSGDFSLPYTGIKGLDATQKTWGFMENRLVITDTSATPQTFIVYQPKLWAEKIAPLLLAS